MACSLSLCPVPAVTWPTILLLTLQPLFTHTHVRTHTSTHQHIQLFCGIFLLKFPPLFFFNSSTISEVCFLLMAGLCVLGGCHLDLLFDLASQLTDLPLISPDPWLAGEKAKEKVMT